MNWNDFSCKICLSVRLIISRVGTGGFLLQKMSNALHTVLMVIVKKSSPKNLSADCRSTVGRQLTERLPTVYRQLANRLPTG